MKRRGSNVWKVWAGGGFAAGALAATGAFAAGSTDEALLHCRAQADIAARLACYDAISVQPAVQRAGAAGNPSAIPALSARTPAAVTADTAPPTPTAAFGLERRRRSDAVDELSSQITGRFEGWGPGTRFTLANGQVWEVSDGSNGVYNLQSPVVVVVRRATMGTFMLEIKGAGKAPRVRRVE